MLLCHHLFLTFLPGAPQRLTTPHTASFTLFLSPTAQEETWRQLQRSREEMIRGKTTQSTLCSHRGRGGSSIRDLHCCSRQEKQNKTSHSCAAVCPEQDHNICTSPTPPVPLEPQGQHHFPTCRERQFSARQSPTGFLHPAASNQRELELVGNVNVLENKLQVGFSSKTSAHDSDHVS